MTMFNDEDLELDGPAFLRFGTKQQGEMRFVALHAWLDYRVITRDGLDLLEFSWEGVSEGDQLSGRGWAQLHGDSLGGGIYIHNGDETGFTAVRE
jgi:hypothetical protein